MNLDPQMKQLLSIMGGILILASIIGYLLHLRFKDKPQYPVIQNLNARIRSWWVMCAVFGITLLVGPIMSTCLFAMISFLALREFITLNQTSRADHASLFWVFFIILPLHYLLVGIQWYGLFMIFIPVYGFIAIPIRRVLSGETKNFLASTAKIQWGLLVCVYFVSHIPMILSLPIKNYGGQNAKLLFFFIFTVQLSDVMQYVWGKMLGKKAIAPAISPSKTWAGTVGGIVTTVCISSLLYSYTPFTMWQAALMALLLCLAGFFGGLVMSAIKRDLGVKDWGHSIAGHGGFMDRIDSLCFAAPLFFHLCGFFFGTGITPAPPSWILQLISRA